MNRIKVVSNVTIYELNDQETTGLERLELRVRSHWNRSNLVVLEVEGERFTVDSDDLRAAIQNATNAR